MLTHCAITIERVTQPDPETLAFLLAAYRELFGERLDTSRIPVDLERFVDVYGSDGGCLLIARNAAGSPVGSIAYRPYDHRFATLDYRGMAVVEVVRLFVAPAYRRLGLGGRLLQALTIAAERAGVARFYLHTHPFLPGAIAFWQRHGFSVIGVDPDPTWQTTHLERPVG